ncbi:hypothetical protein PLESTF_000711400 [Pleodorina starrii]|nr:hypothetical protein PLESTM_001800400 [Pleodorina starrii]GLC68586.1 hypothetical protein PLESTF_000711400 [Pleodorina starrii]
MGNSCNKVTPIVCTARFTCTIPIGCAVVEPKGQPAVVEPAPKKEPAAIEEAPSPAPSPAPAPPAPAADLCPPATTQPATPEGESKPALTLDPVEPFQPTGLVSPAVAIQRAESVDAVADEGIPTTLSTGAAGSKTDQNLDQTEITSVEPIEDQVVECKSADELVGDLGVDDSKDAYPSNADSRAQDDEEASEQQPIAVSDADSVAAGGHREGEDDKARADAAFNSIPAESRSSDDKPPADKDSGDSPDSQVVVTGDAELSDEDSSADLEPFAFDPDALAALEFFQLRDTAEILGSRSGGHAVVQALQSMCSFAMDAGAATQNCQLLLTQIRIVMHVLARAQRDGSRRKAVRALLEELHPTLMSAEALLGCWAHKGSLEKFMSGREADDEFLDMHLQLKDFAQSPSFLELLACLPPHEAADLSDLQSSLQLSGYCCVEAARASYERLMLLFILRYKPTKSRTQRERLMDLLAEYQDPNSPTAAACRTVGADGSPGSGSGSGSGPSPEDQLEHFARFHVGRAATHAAPLMVALMTNMWGADPGSVPRGRTDKWRLAVRMAVEPMRAATGAWQLPVVPLEGVQPWSGENA